MMLGATLVAPLCLTAFSLRTLFDLDQSWLVISFNNLADGAFMDRFGDGMTASKLLISYGVGLAARARQRATATDETPLECCYSYPGSPSVLCPPTHAAACISFWQIRITSRMFWPAPSTTMTVARAFLGNATDQIFCRRSCVMRYGIHVTDEDPRDTATVAATVVSPRCSSPLQLPEPG